MPNNFSLDEITSKLLSIRNIKKDEVNSFLNPSIKNFLPDPYILNDMKNFHFLPVVAERKTLRTLEQLPYVEHALKRQPA